MRHDKYASQIFKFRLSTFYFSSLTTTILMWMKPYNWMRIVSLRFLTLTLTLTLTTTLTLTFITTLTLTHFTFLTTLRQNYLVTRVENALNAMGWDKANLIFLKFSHDFQLDIISVSLLSFQCKWNPRVGFYKSQ